MLNTEEKVMINKDLTNEMTLVLTSDSKNEKLARIAVSAFVSQLDPAVSIIDEVKAAVSEAVTNAIIHGYFNDMGEQVRHGDITLYCKYEPSMVPFGEHESDRRHRAVFYIEIKDQGLGISDIEEAMTPLYTSKPDMDRSGLGFTVMESFMDSIEVDSTPGQGTVVRMTKFI